MNGIYVQSVCACENYTSNVLPQMLPSVKLIISLKEQIFQNLKIHLKIPEEQTEEFMEVFHKNMYCTLMFTDAIQV